MPVFLWFFRFSVLDPTAARCLLYLLAGRQRRSVLVRVSQSQSLRFGVKKPSRCEQGTCVCVLVGLCVFCTWPVGDMGLLLPLQRQACLNTLVVVFGRGNIVMFNRRLFGLVLMAV